VNRSFLGSPIRLRLS